METSVQEYVKSGLAAHLTRLWRYALVLSGRRDWAEDLVQATCLRALERAHQFQLGTRLDRWLFTILRSIWLNEVRAARIRLGEGWAPAEFVLSVDGRAAAETNILAAQVLAAVQALPEAQREAVLLVYVEGLTYREAAEVMAVPVGTIMSRLASARAQLSHLGANDAKKGRAMPEKDDNGENN